MEMEERDLLGALEDLEEQRVIDAAGEDRPLAAQHDDADRRVVGELVERDGQRAHQRAVEGVALALARQPHGGHVALADDVDGTGGGRGAR